MASSQTGIGLIPKSGFRLRRFKLAYLALAIVAALFVLFATFGISILQISKTRAGVEADIAITRHSINGFPGRTNEQLNVQLRDAQLRLDTARNAYADKGFNTDFVAGLLNLGRLERVLITSILSREPRRELIGRHNYLVTPFTITLSGEQQGLMNFIDLLEQDNQHTLVIRTVNFSLTKDGPELTAEVDAYTDPVELATTGQVSSDSSSKSNATKR